MNNVRPIYQIKEEFLKGGLSRYTIAQTMNRFKKELDYNELMGALPEIMRLDSRFKKLIWGNLFPKDYSELGVGNNYYFRSEGVNYELDWILIQIAKHRKEIGLFVTQRDLVFRCLALGDYERAKYEILKIEESLGVSVWSTEMRLMVSNLSGEDQESFELLTRINQAADLVKEKGKTGYVPLLAHFLFKRSSTQSASSYEEELSDINKRNRNDFQADRLKYFQFRLNYYAAEDRSRLESLLIYETANALIDKYMSMVNLLKWLFAGSDAERLVAVGYASRLFGYVPDKDLYPFLAYSGSDKLPKSYYDNSFISVLDSYYRMDYQETLKQCKHFISENPNHFDCIRLYVQSLIFLNSDFCPIVRKEDCVTNRVTLLVYKTLKESDNSATLVDIYDFNKTIYGIPLASGVHCFIKEQRKNRVDKYQKCLSLTLFDPFFSTVWAHKESEHSADYLTKAKKHGILSITVDYYLALLSGFVLDCPQGIAPYIVERDKAIKEYRDKHYDDCVLKCSYLFTNWGKYLSIGQMASEYAFRSYVEQGLKMKAISLFVNRFIDKRALVNSIQTEVFVENLRRERYKKDVRNTIDLQIFVLLNASEDEQKAHVLQMFMDYQDASDMAGLIEAIKDTIPQRKQEVFLFLLVEGDILRHLPYIGSTKQMLEQQQIIVQYLTQLNSTDHELYEESNKQIIQLMISYENIKKLDESRIYVNEPAIIRYELNECESLYRQLVTRNEAAKSVASIYLLQMSDDGIKNGVDAKMMQTEYKATRNVSTDISTQLFNFICQKYLFSKFGLKTYLSTRIRHGVLEGAIRSVFDSLHLMLTTENNRFKPITYWKRTYGLAPDEQDLLMQKLEAFSSNLGKIINVFKEDVVQIRMNDTDSGMFDYIFADEQKSYAVVLAQSKTQDYEEFCTQLLLLLDTFTEKSLVRIRNYIHTEFQKKFIHIIDQLENDVQCLSQYHFYDSLMGAIAQSRESIQGALMKIEKWFSLQRGVYDDFILKDQIELVWEVTQRQYPNIKYNLNLHVEDARIMVDSSHYLDIADMLTIFYNNMFCHSKVDVCREFAISATRDRDSVVLCFENEVAGDINQLNSSFTDLLKMDNRLQLEGRSGLAKVKKIVMFDLGGGEEDFSVVAEKGICKVRVQLNINSIGKNDEKDSIG